MQLPTSVDIFRMMQSYNDFIFALDQKMCLHMQFYSKNVLTHTFLFENWPYAFIFIFMLFLNNTYRTEGKNIMKLQSVIVKQN